MKKLLVLFLTLGVLSSVVSACMGDLGPAGEKGIPAGVSFYTSAQGLQFFFVDEDGNDLVDLDERHSWPLAFPQKVESTTRESAITRATTEAHSDGRVFYVYNDNCNALCKDYDSGLYGFSTYLWGRTVEPEYTTYIYKGSSIDSLNVSYTYHEAQAGQAGGNSWMVQITSVKYNGVEVFEGNENGKVFVRKPSQGETTVTVGSL